MILDELIKSGLEILDPRTIRRRFVGISEELEQIIRSAQDDLSKVEERVIEEADASLFLDPSLISKQAFELLLSEMLGSILKAEDYKGGLFCHATSPDWEHIQTAYVLQIFDHLQLPLGSWFVNDERRSVEQMIVGIIGDQRPDGSWGEDFYDTCYTCNSLLLFNKTHSFVTGFRRAIYAAVENILGQLKSGFSSTLDQEWYGAGFYGAALALFGRHHDQIYLDDRRNMSSTDVESTLETLLQGAMGFYVQGDHIAHFRSDPSSNPTTPDEWHTAEMLIGLHHARHKLPVDMSFVPMCVDWLEGKRADRHLWCNTMGSRISFIITGRVLHALALVDPGKWGRAVLGAAPVLQHYQARLGNTTGLVYDLPVTINLLLGLSAKASVKKRTSHNELQTAILAAELHGLLERVADVKVKTDKNASSYRLALLPYLMLFVFTAVVLTAANLNEVRLLFSELWDWLEKLKEGAAGLR